jgi:hypothetical protein
LVFTVSLKPAYAAPQQLFNYGISQRADNTPGIGVEVEMGNIQIHGNANLEGEKREKIKGAEMTPNNMAVVPKTNWKLTAEVGREQIMAEAIVDGLKNKVGSGTTKAIGVEIYNFFVCLSL